MAEQLDKQTLTRLAWTTELRRQGHRQCELEFDDGEGFVCALGLLREVAGMPPSESLLPLWNDVVHVGGLAGLTADQSRDVAYRNDGISCRKHSFRELADFVDGLFQ